MSASPCDLYGAEPFAVGREDARTQPQALKAVRPEAGVMSTETQTDEEDLRDRIGNFLMRNFPQIQMHGGSHAIRDLDPETGEVTIMLGGACSGCGISPMTIQAIKSRMVKEIPEIETVHADTGMGGGGMEASGPSFPGETLGDEGRDSGGPTAPF